jgi:putative FmdB family regulatory protein
MLRMYDYHCPHCDRYFEALAESTERHFHHCHHCEGTAQLVIRSVPMLDPRMGVDKDFPTMAKRWDEKHKKLAYGQMKDSNNTRYGTKTDYEREAFYKRRELEK